MNRRNFIRSTAMMSGGLILSFHNVTGKVISVNASSEPHGINAFGDLIKINSDGEVLFQFIKHEMGQGVSTSMAMILAEELCADWEKVKIEFPSTDMKKFQNGKNGGHDTGGSCTIIYQYDLLRKAGATARQMLMEAAAKQWNTTIDNCYAKNHWVIHKTSSKRISFGELAPLAAVLSIPKEVKLKDKNEFKLIGKVKSAKLIPDIVTGRIHYSLDVQVPGILYAVVARCPVFKGKLVSFDATQTLKVTGVKKVFNNKPIAGLQTVTPFMPHDIREGVVVVADSFWAAKRGRDALIIKWDEGKNVRYNSEDFERWAEQHALHRTDPTGYIGDENAVSDMNQVRKTLRASYVFQHQLHSCMEPLNCTAHVQGNSCEIWIGSQAPNLIVTELVRVFQFDEDKINVHNFPSGGGFGRRYYPDMAVEAAFISREAGNVPVKMLWTREDDQQHNLAHHFQHVEFQVALDKDNHLYAWYEKGIRTYTWGAKYANPQLPFMAYKIPNIRYDFEDSLIGEELVHSGAWRGVAWLVFEGMLH